VSASGRQKRFGFWRISLILFVLAVIFLPIGLLSAISDSRPLVTESAKIDSNSAIKARRIAKQFYRGLMRPASAPSSRITLSEIDLNEVLALAVRGVRAAKAQARIDSAGLTGNITLHLPQNPFGDYINVTANIEPFSDGLKVSKLIVGDLKLSGRILLGIAESLLNRALEGETLGSELLAAIESLAVNSSRVTVVYHPVPNFRHKVNRLKEQVQFAEDDSQLVRSYYQQLCTFRQQGSSGGYVALGSYLSHIFHYAQQRSLVSGQATEENRAALLALALFLGSNKFDTLIGALDNNSCRPARGNIGLANRNDLRLHFVFSAALQVMSSSGVSFSIGEFKELLDTERGGSGFSFADLAADRAGIRFAEFAVDEDSARQLHKVTAEFAKETVFFPSISGLPEGIHQQEFERQGGIESEFYKKHLATIEQRIDRLALYQTP
jgi:uncharacterized protein YfiM (DUF2279 family)